LTKIPFLPKYIEGIEKGGTMESITVQNISDDLNQQIAVKAEEWNLSPAETIKKIVQNALVPKPPELIQFTKNWTEPAEEAVYETSLNALHSRFQDGDDEESGQNDSVRIYLVEPASAISRNW
jgi:hypothetical protein